jgi:hypothetical protein
MQKLWGARDLSGKPCLLCGQIHEFLTKNHILIASASKEGMEDLFGKLGGTEVVEVEISKHKRFYDYPMEIAKSLFRIHRPSEFFSLEEVINAIKKEKTMPLTAVQETFVELDKKKKAVEEFYQQYDAAIAAVVHEAAANQGEGADGIGAFFQDEEGTVYKTDIPKGTFVSFKPLTILRTRREGEKQGTLALKTAQEAGFEVK